MTIKDFAAVRTLGLRLPGVVEATAYGAPALKLGGKIVACVPTNKSAEPNSLMVKIDPEQRAELLRQQPRVYYVTDHYEPHPTVLVRLASISQADLKELLHDACRYVAGPASRAKRPTTSRRRKPASKR